MDTALKQFGIFSSVLGEREDIPSVTLPTAYHADSENVLLRYQGVERIKGRFGELLEKAYTTGTVAVTNGSKTVTLSNAGWASAATHKPYWTGRTITISDSVAGIDIACEIASVTYNAANSVITLAENYTGNTAAAESYSIGTAGTKVKTPDANPIIRYHRLVINGTEYLFAFTKAHVYLWADDWSAFVLKFTCSDDCEQWSTAEINNKIIATNNVDKVQVWGSDTDLLFANLDSASGVQVGAAKYIQKAKVVCVYHNYVMLANVTANGSPEERAIYWCSYDDETAWQIGVDGDSGMLNVDGNDEVVAFATYDTDLIVGKAKTTHRMWLVTNDDVFNLAKVRDIGWISGACHVNDKEGRLFWLASDYTIRELMTHYSVSDAKDKTFRDINPQLAEFSCACHIPMLDINLWSVPYGEAATANNKVIWQNSKTGAWGEIDLAVPAFGSYTRHKAYQWSTLPFSGWTEWGWDSWNSIQNVAGYNLDLASDADGYTYDLFAVELDDGDSYSGYFVMATDLSQKRALASYKRVLEMELYFRGESAGSAVISCKRDNEAAWQAVGTIDLTSTDSIARIHLPCDIRARDFRFKITASNRFAFYGVIFGFYYDGMR